MSRRACGSLAVFSLLLPSLAWAGPPERVWVFFEDHGRSDEQLRVELEQRSAELGPRTLARRSKVRDGALVDARDLLPAARYVSAVERSGARLRVRSRWLNAVSVDADVATQRALAKLPFVRGLWPLARATPRTLELGAPPAQANIDDYGMAWAQLQLIGVPALHDCGLTGQGVILGVQDAGFVLEHQAFADIEVLATYDFVNQDPNVGIDPGDPPEQHLHGSAVLSTIVGEDLGSFRGVAPGVSLILSKTEDVALEEPFEEDYYVAGLEWIEGMGADLFTASLGYVYWYTYDDFDGASAVTSIAVENAVANGLIVFAPIGNFGPDPQTLIAPADAPGAITIGAVDVMGELAPFSSRGPTADGRIKPDLVAPGWDVVAIDPTTTSEYMLISGTSLATPIAAGVAALLLEADPSFTPTTLANMLRETASQAGAPDNGMGYGIIDAVAIGKLYCDCFDVDLDQHQDAACGGDDCDDGHAGSHPGATEVCDGLDNDCDTMLLPEELDVDMDEFLACGGDDCDDTNPNVFPGAYESCDNGIDDDCDQLIDAADPDCTTDPGTSDTGTSDTGGSESNSGVGDPAEVDDASGCACAARRGGRSLALLLLPLLGLVRRRTRR